MRIHLTPHATYLSLMRNCGVQRRASRWGRYAVSGDLRTRVALLRTVRGCGGRVDVCLGRGGR
jgi:hypothetical protein